MAVSKRMRTSKTSSGKRRSSKPIPLTRLELTLLGKGPAIATAARQNREAIKEAEYRRRVAR